MHHAGFQAVWIGCVWATPAKGPHITLLGLHFWFEAGARNDCLPAWVISWRSTMGGRWVALGWVGGGTKQVEQGTQHSRSKGVSGGGAQYN